MYGTVEDIHICSTYSLTVMFTLTRGCQPGPYHPLVGNRAFKVGGEVFFVVVHTSGQRMDEDEKVNFNYLCINIKHT